MKILKDENDLYVTNTGRKIYGSLSGKFEVGDSVRIIDKGKAYTTYTEMVEAMALNNYIRLNSSNYKWKDIGVVVNRKIHQNFDDIVYGIKLNNRIILIGEEGLEKINKSSLLEETSFRISKTLDFGDDIFYRADCGCGCKDCGLELELGLNKDEIHNNFSLSIFQDTSYFDFWSCNDGFWGRFWSRIYTALRVLCLGKIKVSSEFIFQGEEQVKSFITALEEGMVKIKGSRE